MMSWRLRRAGVHGLLVLLAGGLILAACDDDDTGNAGAGSGLPRPVRVITVEQGAPTETRRFPGTIQAAQASRMSFQVPGKIESFPVREGQTIAEGDLIAALDSTDYELTLRKAEVEEDRLKKELARKAALRVGGHVSQATLDTAQAAYDQAAVAREQAEKNLSYTTLQAPFDAIIAERLVDTFVNVQAGTPVVLVQDISTLEVDVDVPERIIVRQREDNILSLSASLFARPDLSFPLHLKEVATEPDPQTRTYKATLSMEAPKVFTVLPGMSATVTVILRDPEAALLSVPAEAVDAGPDGAFRVWTYDAASGTVSPMAVEVGRLSGGKAEILDGLKGGETVVVAGVGALAEGMAVRPVDPPVR